jgi:hypothetical protein
LAFQRINAKLDTLLGRLDQDTTEQTANAHLETLLMAKIDDLEAEVTKVGTVQESAITLINDIAQQLRDSRANDPRIQAVIDSLDQRATALAAAVTANTPATPTP